VEILIIRHLKRVVLNWEVLLFTRKRLHQQNRQISGTWLKKISKCVCTSTVRVFPKPLIPTPTLSAIKTPENIVKDPYDPEPTDEEDIQVEFSSD